MDSMRSYLTLFEGRSLVPLRHVHLMLDDHARGAELENGMVN